MLERVTEVGMIERFSMGRALNVVTVHMQFVDDTIIFCDNSQRQIWLLRCVLRCFEAVSGLCLNLAKSLLFVVGEVSNLDQLTADLGCKRGYLPAMYLELPLGSTYK